MELEARLREDLKVAMKARDTLRTSVLRMALADVTNGRIAKGGPLDDGDVLALLKSAVKRRRDSIEQFEKGGRPELAAKERAEIEILDGYLPAQLGAADIDVVVDAVIAEMGASSKKEMGRVMKEVMARLAGRADGKVVSGIVGARLH